MQRDALTNSIKRLPLRFGLTRPQNVDDPSELAKINATRALCPSNANKILEGLNNALSRGDHAELAIRIAQNQRLSHAELFRKANFDPSQPRNPEGEWSKTGAAVSSKDGTDKPFDITTSDGFCRIVKQLCIVEATDVLPTSDYGMTFFKALNACMDRHGCLGRA